MALILQFPFTKMSCVTSGKSPNFYASVSLFAEIGDYRIVGGIK